MTIRLEHSMRDGGEFCDRDPDGNTRRHCLHDTVLEGGPSQVCCHCGDLFLERDDGPHGKCAPSIAADCARLRELLAEAVELVPVIGAWPGAEEFLERARAALAATGGKDGG